MLTLVVRDLQYRRWRIALVVLLISVVITLLFLISGILGQLDHEPTRAVEQIGGERSYVVSSNSSGPLTTPQAVPRSTVNAISGSTVFLMGRAIVDDQALMLIGLPSREIRPELVDGMLPVGGSEMIVDESAGYRVGDVLELGGRETTVVGLTTDTSVLAGLPLAFVPLPRGQSTLASGQDIVSGALVDEPLEVDPDDLRVMSAAEVADDTRTPLASAIDSVSVLRVLLWAVTGVLIGTTIYATATTRVRDVAVLKAVGGRDSFLATALILEAVLIAVVSTGLAAVMQQFARPLFPLTARVSMATWWQVPTTAVVIALIAAVLGVRKVLLTSPAEAFA